MLVSFALPWAVKKRSAANSAKIERIKDLKDQMSSIGYNPSEVDYLIMSLSNGENISNLDAKELKKIEIAIESHLDFAKKCIKLGF